MALTQINVGSSANDGTGDTVRAAFQLCNTAFTAVDASLPLTGGTLTGNLTFNDTGEGLSLHGGGVVTGASGALSLTASGTNQNITLTPSGTGKVVVGTLSIIGGQQMLVSTEAYPKFTVNNVSFCTSAFIANSYFYCEPSRLSIGAANGSAVVSLYADAAEIFAQRNSTNAQTSRVYGTYTDASNYVRASLAASSTLVTLAAETAGTGADNVDINLTTAGTGLVNLATQTASVDVIAASTHSVQIKIGGTTYKVLLST